MAVFGLGETSPIILQLTRENFNAMIKRHGQYVRWLSSNRCPCIGLNGRVDEDCILCDGTGISYDSITDAIEVITANVLVDGVVELPEGVESIISVQDSKGNTLEVLGQCDDFITVSGVVRGDIVTISFNENTKKSSTGEAIYISDSLYQIDIPLDVKFGSVSGDILSVIAYNETQGSPLTVNKIFRNYFEVEEVPLETDIITVAYDYIEPFNFVILSQNLKEHDRKFLVDMDGDAIMTFPQKWDITEEDIIIALNADIMRNHVFKSTGSDIDKLPSFYVSELKSAYSIRSGVKHIFTPYTDFVIYKGNSIKWITANKPGIGEQVSINYSHNITYRVLKEFPSPRTSENNRFPRKVGLKVYTDINSREDF